MTPATGREVPLDVEIRSDVQLLVEGDHLRHFAEAQLRDLSRDDVDVHSFGGVTQLRRFLNAFVDIPDFGRVRSLGIVRDAEESAARALASVQNACENAELMAPQRVGEPQGKDPRVSCWILPDGERPGMLETLLWETVADSAEGQCVEDFFACVERCDGPEIKLPDKARAYAWIATRPRPEASVGIAAQRGYWNLQHKALSGLRRFLAGL